MHERGEGRETPVLAGDRMVPEPGRNRFGALAGFVGSATLHAGAFALVLGGFFAARDPIRFSGGAPVIAVELIDAPLTDETVDRAGLIAQTAGTPAPAEPSAEEKTLPRPRRDAPEPVVPAQTAKPQTTLPIQRPRPDAPEPDLPPAPVETAKKDTGPPLPAPRPQRAPAHKPKPSPSQTAKAKKTVVAKPKTPRASTGTAQTSRSGTASSGAVTRKATGKRQAGNAALSSYPGQVARKLRRATRYPADARQRGETGRVLVHFVIQKNGTVRALKIMRSSGSPRLDRAALDAVRRAAPFPALPAGKRDWAFTVPIVFSRQ